MVGVAGRQGRARARLPRRRRRRALRRGARRARRGCRTRTCSTSAASPSCSATTASSTRSTIPVSPRGYRILGRIPRLPEARRRRASSASSADSTSCSPPPTPSWRPSRASARSGRRTSARACAGCRRSTSWTATCRPEPSTAAAAGAAANEGGHHSADKQPKSSIEDLEVTVEVEHIEFEIGDNVVYPHHGAGKVLKKEEKEMLGEKREYLTIKILHNDMTVMVPSENAAHGRPAPRDRRGDGQEGARRAAATTSRRCRRTGTAASSTTATRSRPATSTSSPRSCATSRIRESEKGLSTGEKQMFTRAKKILASELMYALDMDEEEAEELPRRAARRLRHGERQGGRRPRRSAATRGVRELRWRSRCSWPPVAASALAPVGPRRSSCWPAGRCSQWSARRAARVAGDRADRRRAAAGRRARAGAATSASTGGAARSDSVRARARGAGDAGDPVLVHDAARPLLTPELSSACARRARRDGAADAAIAAAPVTRHGQAGRRRRPR